MPFEELLAYFVPPADPEDDNRAYLQTGERQARGRYRGLRLSSVFQPLIAAASLQTSAYEALLRVHDQAGGALSPAAAFALPASDEEAVHFDRLCRVMHTLNFIAQAGSEVTLFLNLSGRHLLGVENGDHGAIFERLLGLCGVKPERIVLEIIEARVDDIARLNEAVESYRHRGYRVAIDDFGCEDSNFDRLWRLTPDIVKLDRSLIVQSITNMRARRILPKIVDIIHELGAEVVCEGIETADQHELAVDAGSDLLQGFYYARPQEKLLETQATAALPG